MRNCTVGDNYIFINMKHVSVFMNQAKLQLGESYQINLELVPKVMPCLIFDFDNTILMTFDRVYSRYTDICQINNIVPKKLNEIISKLDLKAESVFEQLHGEIINQPPKGLPTKEKYNGDLVNFFENQSMKYNLICFSSRDASSLKKNV